MLTVYKQIIHLWGEHDVLDLWEQKTAEQQQLELQLQLLLPTVLLHCAVEIPPSSPAWVHGKYCLLAAKVCQGATNAWSRLSHHKANEAGGHQGLCSHHHHQQQQEQESVQLTGDWVAEVLPAALKLAWRVLPQLQEDADLLISADPNAQSSSSSRHSDGGAGSMPASSAAAETGADTALHDGASSHSGECLQLLLRFFAIICDSVLPPAVTGARESGIDRLAAIFAHHKAETDHPVFEKVKAFWGRGGAASSSQSDAAASGDSISQGQQGSSSDSEGAAMAQSDTTSQPLAAGDSVSAVAGSVVPFLRVLEAFLRTDAGAPATPPSCAEDCQCQHSPPADIPLQQLLGCTLVPTADAPSSNRNPQWDYEPAAPALLQLAISAGPGSAAQHALYSLLFSVVKLSVLQSSKAPGLNRCPACSTGLQHPDCCVLLAVDAATYLLRAAASDTADTAAASERQLSADTAAADTAAAASPTEGLPAGSSSSTCSAEPPRNAAAAQQQAAGLSPQPSAAVQLLPSIVIFGRLCLLYGQQLPAKIPLMVQMKVLKTLDKGLQGINPAGLMQLLDLYQREAPPSSVVDVLWREAPGGGGLQTKFEIYLQACLNWLNSGSVSEQLAAAGYGSAASTAVQQLQALTAAIDVAQKSETMDPGPFAAMIRQLLETGKALSSFAVPLCCNHPMCANISRTLEVSLVSGHSTKCSGCKVARYCCRECQKQHWKQHKPVCQALAAARGASGLGKGAGGAA